MEFKRDDVEIPCFGNAYAIRLKNQKIFISGHFEDNGEEYEFYSIDLQRNMEKKGLLPYHQKYALTSQNYKKQDQENNLSAIGSAGVFDLDQNGNAYAAWIGNLRIIKFDTESGVSEKIFGKHIGNYSMPNPTLELVDGYKKGDFKVIQKEKKKMSLLRNVFLTKKHLLVVFEGPFKTESESAFWLQFYSLEDGSFQKERRIPGEPKMRMRLDKDKNILYSFSGGPDGSEYYIQKYLILE